LADQSQVDQKLPLALEAAAIILIGAADDAITLVEPALASKLPQQSTSTMQGIGKAVLS
jgi:hypothetical protein